MKWQTTCPKKDKNSKKVFIEGSQARPLQNGRAYLWNSGALPMEQLPSPVLFTVDRRIGQAHLKRVAIQNARHKYNTVDQCRTAIFPYRCLLAEHFFINKPTARNGADMRSLVFGQCIGMQVKQIVGQQLAQPYRVPLLHGLESLLFGMENFQVSFGLACDKPRKQEDKENELVFHKRCFVLPDKVTQLKCRHRTTFALLKKFQQKIMRSTYVLFAVVLLAAFFTACKSDTSKAAVVADQPDKPELFLYTAKVENLRLREAPNQNSNVLAQLKEGEVVEGAGNESTNQEEIELRGISYRAPYYQVTATTGDRHSGWAFGGALTWVYAGPRTSSPDTKRIGDFSAFLKTLDTKDLTSGGKAWGYVQQNLADAPRSLSDVTFILLEQFLRRMEIEGEFYKLMEQVAFTEEDDKAVYNERFDYSKYPATAPIDDNGFRLVWSEGSIFPVVDWQKLQEYFGPLTTQTMQKFINQRTSEQRVPIFGDGGIVIPLSKLADVAVFWEKFNLANPYFPLREETRESEFWMRLVLLNGSDNSPVFTSETNLVSEDFKSVWEYIRQQYPNTELGKRTKELTDLCAAEGWKRTEKVDAFRENVAQQYTNQQ